MKNLGTELIPWSHRELYRAPPFYSLFIPYEMSEISLSAIYSERDPWAIKKPVNAVVTNSIKHLRVTLIQHVEDLNDKSFKSL